MVGVRDHFQLWRLQNGVVLLGADMLDWPEHAYDSVVLGSRVSGLKAGRLEKHSTNNGAFSSSYPAGRGKKG